MPAAMIEAGETTVHFTKLKAAELAEMRSVLQKRPKAKFSVGLSPEAQEAMQQVQEETKIQQAAKRGKRGSKGNVLFSETVHIRQEHVSPTRGRRPSYSDVFESARLDGDYPGYSTPRGSGVTEPGSPRRAYHGRRRGSVTQWLAAEKQTTVIEQDEVDLVLSANMAPPVSPAPGL